MLYTLYKTVLYIVFDMCFPFTCIITFKITNVNVEFSLFFHSVFRITETDNVCSRSAPAHIIGYDTEKKVVTDCAVLY